MGDVPTPSYLFFVLHTSSLYVLFQVLVFKVGNLTFAAHVLFKCDNCGGF